MKKNNNYNSIKKIALTTIMVFISYIALSQPRVDGKVTAKILRSSSIISDIVGWEYDMTTKKWCGYYNTLRNIYSQNNKIPKRISPSKMSACDNIISIQIKTVLFNGRKYYLLIIPFYSGDWRYPEILRDWYFGKVNNVYILKEEEYEKMKKLDDGINHIKVIKGKSYGHPSFSWFETFNQAFISLFDDDKGEIDDSDFFNFYIKKEDDNIVRFQNMSYNKLETGKKDEMFDNPNFDMRYYEIKMSEYSKLFVE